MGTHTTGDYNGSFALLAVELKMVGFSICFTKSICLTSISILTTMGIIEHVSLIRRGYSNVFVEYGFYFIE